MNNNRVFLAFMVILCSIGYTATDIYLPALPAIGDYFNTTNTYVQLTLFAYLLSFGLTPIFIGPYSDQVGRRPVILLGLAASLIITLGCLFPPNIGSLIAIRFLQGISLAAVVTASRTMVPDKFRGPEMAKFNSLITMFIPIIFMIAPPIGGLIQEAFGWRAVFGFLLVYIALTLIVSVIWLPETHPVKPSPDRRFSISWSTYGQLFCLKPFMLFGLIPCLTFISLSAYMTVSPFLFQDLLGLSPKDYGLLSLASGSMMILSAFLNKRLLPVFSPLQLLFSSAILQCIAGIILMLFYWLDLITPLSLLLPSMIIFLAVPLAMPNAFSLAFGYIKDNFGTAGALISTLQLFAGCLSSLVFSFIPEESVLPLAIVFFSMGLLIFVNLLQAPQAEAATS